jgi:hypothetical protein
MHPFKARRRVGPKRAGGFGLRTQVEVTDARNAVMADAIEQGIR